MDERWQGFGPNKLLSFHRDTLVELLEAIVIEMMMNLKTFWLRIAREEDKSHLFFWCNLYNSSFRLLYLSPSNTMSQQKRGASAAVVNRQRITSQLSRDNLLTFCFHNIINSSINPWKWNQIKFAPALVLSQSQFSRTPISLWLCILDSRIALVRIKLKRKRGEDFGKNGRRGFSLIEDCARIFFY